MFKRFLAARQSYPPQFWLILAGLLFSTIGTSMIFPFLTIYVSERLDLPLTEVAWLITLNGAVALLASFGAGPAADRLGRKWIMVISLLGNGATYYLLGQASTYLAFAILMASRGFFMPLYKVGTNAMISDLVPPEQRPDAFALMRIADNVGIAIGPAIGGIMVATSYGIGFAIASITLISFGLLIAVFARETAPAIKEEASLQVTGLGGYGRVVRDREFMTFIFSFTLFKVCSVMLWAFSAVYAKQNFQLSESQFGFIPATNALMVVLFQVGVTKITKRYLPLPVLSIGTLIYALGVGSMALGQGFWGFWLSFVVLTVGELMIMPTSSSYVANMAPVDMRGRYMSSFSFSQGIARSVAPLFGGMLNDFIGPQAIWYGGGMMGLSSAACFAWMARRYAPRSLLKRATRKKPVAP